MSLQTRPWRLIVLSTLMWVYQLAALLRSLTYPPALTAQLNLWQPLEILASGLWALIFAGLAVTLIRNRISRWTTWAFIGFIVYSALRLYLFAQSDYDRSRLTFILLAALLIVALLLARRRQR